MKQKIVMMSAMMLVLGWSAPTWATLIEIGITAKVWQVDDRANLLEGKIQVDDIITGVYRYDSETVDSNPSDTIGDYWYNSTPYGVYLNANNLFFGTKNNEINFLMEMANNHLNSFDHYEFISYKNTFQNQTDVEIISWILKDDDQLALNSDVLPISAPNITGGWDTNYLVIQNSKYDIFKIEACVTNSTLIPEPSTIFLLSLGGILFIKRKTKL